MSIACVYWRSRRADLCLQKMEKRKKNERERKREREVRDREGEKEGGWGGGLTPHMCSRALKCVFHHSGGNMLVYVCSRRGFFFSKQAAYLSSLHHPPPPPPSPSSPSFSPPPLPDMQSKHQELKVKAGEGFFLFPSDQLLTFGARLPPSTQVILH